MTAVIRIQGFHVREAREEYADPTGDFREVEGEDGQIYELLRNGTAHRVDTRNDNIVASGTWTESLSDDWSRS